MLPYINILGLQVPMYGICLASGFIICTLIALYRTVKRKKSVYGLVVIAALVLGLAIIGGTLLYTLVTYSLSDIWAMITAGNRDGLFGGIVFYGGLAGGLAGGFLGARISGCDISDYIDIIVPVIPLGQAIGRTGCFLSGCCYGIPSDSPIAVIFTDPAGGAPRGIPLLPVQLFEAGIDIIIFIVLMIVSHNTASKYLTAFLYCVLYGISRFVLEFFRYDSIRGFAGGLSTSQWISLFMISAAVVSLILYRQFISRRSSC